MLIMARVVGGERGGRVLLNEGFRYHHNRTARDKIYWKCWRPHCRAGLQTNVFDRQGDHNQAVLVLGVSKKCYILLLVLVVVCLCVCGLH